MTDLKQLKRGDKVFFKMTGFGMTTYEGPEKVLENRGDKLFTQSYDEIGLDWDDLRKTWIFKDSPLRTSVCDPADNAAYNAIKKDAQSGDRMSLRLLKFLDKQRAETVPTASPAPGAPRPT